VTGNDGKLSMEWTRHKCAILKVAENDAMCQQVLRDIVDEFDEGKLFALSTTITCLGQTISIIVVKYACR